MTVNCSLWWLVRLVLPCLCPQTGRKTRPLLLVDDRVLDMSPLVLGGCDPLTVYEDRWCDASCVPGLVSTCPRVLGDVTMLATLGRYGTLMG